MSESTVLTLVIDHDKTDPVTLRSIFSQLYGVHLYSEQRLDPDFQTTAFSDTTLTVTAPLTAPEFMASVNDTTWASALIEVDREEYMQAAGNARDENLPDHADYVHERLFSFGEPTDPEIRIVAASEDSLLIHYSTDINLKEIVQNDQTRLQALPAKIQEIIEAAHKIYQADPDGPDSPYLSAQIDVIFMLCDYALPDFDKNDPFEARQFLTRCITAAD